MNGPWTARVALGAALLLASTVPAEAQLGRLRRAVEDRVERAVTGAAEKKIAERMGTGQTSDADVLEISAETLDRFAAALAAEESKRAEVAAVLASLPARRQAQAAERMAQSASESEWRKCSREVQESPESKKRIAELEAQAKALAEQVRSGAPNHVELQQAAIKIQAAQMAWFGEMTAAIASRCGPEPAADSGVGDSEALPDEARLRSEPMTRALAAGQFNERQYAILKERIVPFCAGGARADSDVRIPGANNKFYVYSQAEAQALAPRCAELTARLRAVL